MAPRVVSHGVTYPRRAAVQSSADHGAAADAVVAVVKSQVASLIVAVQLLDRIKLQLVLAGPVMSHNKNALKAGKSCVQKLKLQKSVIATKSYSSTAHRRVPDASKPKFMITDRSLSILVLGRSCKGLRWFAQGSFFSFLCVSSAQKVVLACNENLGSHGKRRIILLIILSG